MHALKLYGPQTGRQNSYGAARGPYGPREYGTYDFCKIFLRCPCGNRTGPARESSLSLISCGTRTEPVRDAQVCRTAPLRTRKKIDTTRICKNLAQESYVAVRDPYGPLAVLIPAVHGKAKFVQRCTGPVRPLRSQ